MEKPVVNWRDELDDQSRAAYEEWLNAQAIRYHLFGDDVGELFEEPDSTDGGRADDCGKDDDRTTPQHSGDDAG